MLAISKRKPEIQRKRFVVDRACFLRNLIGFVHANDTGLLRPIKSPGPNHAEQFYLRPLPAAGCGHRACRDEAGEGEVPVAVFPPERARPALGAPQTCQGANGWAGIRRVSGGCAGARQQSSGCAGIRRVSGGRSSRRTPKPRVNRGIAKGPGDPLPGERACHGRHAPGFRA